MLLVILADLRLRGDRLVGMPPKYAASYAAAVLESGVLWGSLLVVASARRGWARWLAAVVFAVFAMVAIGGQVYFHRQYATYLNLDATLWGTSLSESLFGQLRADGKNFLSSVVPPLVVALVLVALGRRALRPGRRAIRVGRLVAPVASVAVFLIPCSYRTVQASTPDVIYFHAIGGLAKELSGVRTTAQVRPGLRTPPKMPALVPRPARPRNVLFILTESVRADVACSAHAPPCPVMPDLDASLPARIPLAQMRANSSTTAIQLAVLWSGLEPNASREDLHGFPLLFDYAAAARLENAYWTSHHMMFANSRLYVQDLPTTFQCGATDLDPLADIDLGAKDELLTARAEEQVGAMREPFLGVVHYGNTHVPYRIDPENAPFTPWSPSKDPDDNEAYRAYYKNAIHYQQRTIAALVRAVRESPLGPRTVIVFTSDHGEAFREHAQLGHTGSIYDEEVHVPFFVDAPPGTLSADEEQALRAARDTPVFHTDVTPTVLDLLGLWDDPAIAPWRARMPGSPLTRPLPAERPIVALTNCTEIWGCAFKNWGVMQGRRKLAAREWDHAWLCYDLAEDPREERPLPLERCGDLVARAEALYGGIPSAK